MADTQELDLNKFSTPDLIALKSGDLDKVSTEGLLMLKASQPQAPQPAREIPAYQSAIVGAGKGIGDPLLAAGQYMGGKPAELANVVLNKMKPFQEANPMTFGAGQIGGGMLTGGALMKRAGMIPSFARANPYMRAGGVGDVTGALTPN